MKIVKLKDFFQWVLDQPDDREFNMASNKIGDECGCLMIHYGKDQAWDFDGCGLSVWTIEEGVDEEVFTAKFENYFQIDSFLPLNFKGQYGDIKPKVEQKLNELD